MMVREREGDLIEGKEICTLEMYCNREEKEIKSDGQRKGDLTKGRERNTPLG